jgi:acetyltransferase-like isoleucine patch superfamily enzyme
MIQQRLSVKLAVAAVFIHPTIRELGSIIDSQTTGSAATVSTRTMQGPDETQPKKAQKTEGVKTKLLTHFGLESEHLLQGALNRILQLAARVAPTGLRTVFHRWRGVKVGDDVLIGYDTIIETSYPWLVSIGKNSAIGMRVTIIGHFLGAESLVRKNGEVSIQIGENVWIGPGSLILPNVTIGNGSVVAAGSIVSNSVPPGTLVQGNPAIAVARCPVPVKRGIPFEEFIKHLEPLDRDHQSPSTGFSKYKK